MVRAAGIEPAPQAWEAHVLPIYYARGVGVGVHPARRIERGKGFLSLPSKDLGLRQRPIGWIDSDHMALKDIIPLDALLGNPKPKKKKKVDRAALASPMMRIPRMDVRAARDLLDIGVRELYQLQGRSAESLFEDVKAKKPDVPEYRLPYFRMAIYFAETEDPQPDLLHPKAWEE